jgi:pyruvate/2-oxoglutarate dehydrogenase complex dihydrolipoamide dehydrogenase (E3) component/uncharacterized membrane protein YdjX (TVP38/TMEM64 family)
MNKGRAGKIGVLLLAVAGIVLFFGLGLDDQLTLQSLQAKRSALAAMAESDPVLVIGGFFLLYVVCSALSIPGSVLALSLAAGAIFGLLLGTIIVSFASTLGACLSFLGARYLARDWVRARLGRRMEAIDRGVAQDGALYLLSLRLMAIIPFFLINLGMGLTKMRLVTFALVSQAGMLLGTILYVNAGTQLGQITDVSAIFSGTLIASLALLGLVPLLLNHVLKRLRLRRLYRGYKRPKKFDRNLIVIGGGAGGLVTAYIAATVRAKVTLVEAHKMGGDCLNTGCIPSKALIRSARAAHDVRQAGTFGIDAGQPQVRFRDVMERLRGVIRAIEPADSVERYTDLGVDVRIGHARIVDPWTVEIDGSDRLTSRAIVIAAGAEPFVPPIPGLEEAGYLTSETMWDALAGREEVPGRIAIVGGGPIGTEMAQAFARLGSHVTLVEGGERILPNEDAEVSAFVEDVLRREGVDVCTAHEAVRCEGKVLIVRGAPPLDGEGLGRGGIAARFGMDEEITPTQPSPIKGEGSTSVETAIPFDEIIVAVGRKARLSGYGLEELAIETERTIVTNDYLQTLYPNIFAAGDVAGPYQFTHFAAHQAWYAAVNALFGSFRKFRADYSVIPWVTYTDPEVAHVGYNEQSAGAAGVGFEVVRYDLSHLDRALAESAAEGFVKLLVQPGGDRILGATVVGAHAGELIAEFVLAMKHGIGLNKLLGTIHAYPTMAEANKYAAGEWKKARKPERLLRWAERYHAWRRG